LALPIINKGVEQLNLVKKEAFSWIRYITVYSLYSIGILKKDENKIKKDLTKTN